MKIKTFIQSVLVSTAVLSITTLSADIADIARVGTAIRTEAVSIGGLPGSNCKAYYAGQQNRLNNYSGTVRAKSTVRVICPLQVDLSPVTLSANSSLNTLVRLEGRNASGSLPACYLIKGSKWTRMTPTRGSKYNFSLFVSTPKMKRTDTDMFSISCLLSPNDSLTKTEVMKAKTTEG